MAGNLVRHANGTYYLRAKVHGKLIRESLRVMDARIAKIKRDDRLAALWSAVVAGKHGKVLPMRIYGYFRDTHSSAAVEKPD